MKHLKLLVPIIVAVLFVMSGIGDKGAFDVNAGGTTKGGDVPVIPGLVADNGVGTDDGGDVPVTPGLTTRDPQIAAGNGGKVGEVPVVTG